MAHAQDTAATPAPDTAQSPGDIIVTAGKREQSLQDVPAAVSVISGSTLAHYNYQTLTDISRLDPAVQFTSNGVGDNSIIIRGIKSSGAATVALYLDEAVITGFNAENATGGRTPDLGSHDLDRVEILKGPQGTLFGASSMAGTVRLITKKPDLDAIEGGGWVGYSNGAHTAGLYEGETYVNLPVVDDKFGVRVVGWYSKGGGYIDDTSSGKNNVNDYEIRGVRGNALWKPVEDFSLTLTALHQEISIDGTQRFQYGYGDYNNPTPTLEPNKQNDNLFSAVAAYDLGFGSITASSSYYKQKVFEYVDTTPTATSFGLPGNYDQAAHQNRSVWSNELRFASKFSGPLQVVVGGFYEQDKNYYNIAIVQTPTNGLPPCSTAAECITNGLNAQLANVSAREVSLPTKAGAVFGQADYKILPNVTLTGGVRYFKARIHNTEYTLQSLRFPSDPTSLQTVPTLATDGGEKESKVSYNGAISYEPSRDLTLYARVASGFRTGGVNNASFAAQFGVTVPNGYKSDSLTNYEAGLKGKLANGIVTYDIAGYRIDWSNQQVPAYAAGGAFTYTTNAGKSVVNGFEAQVNLHAMPGLTFSGGVTYTDSHLTQDQPIDPTNLTAGGKKGDRVPFVSKWSGTFQADYERPLNDKWTGYVTGAANYRSSAYTDFNANASTYFRIGNYVLADVTLGARTEHWDVSFIVRNITDSTPRLSADVSVDGFRVTTQRPRTFGIRIGAKY